MSLPPPTDLSRQVGIGSPIALSRGSSTGTDLSDIRSPDEEMRYRLLAYKTYLEHESDFLNNEITALIERQPGTDRYEERILADLRTSLKVRFNGIQRRLQCVRDLLTVL